MPCILPLMWTSPHGEIAKLSVAGAGADATVSGTADVSSSNAGAAGCLAAGLGRAGAAACLAGGGAGFAATGLAGASDVRGAVGWLGFIAGALATFVGGGVGVGTGAAAG